MKLVVNMASKVIQPKRHLLKVRIAVNIRGKERLQLGKNISVSLSIHCLQVPPPDIDYINQGLSISIVPVNVNT